MRRLFLSLVSVLASSSLMFGVAAAQSTDCSIVNTGPDSNNTCTVTNSNDIKVTCKNDVDVVFVNNQSANSGSVTLENNTNGGYAYSGNAVNTNSTTGKLDVSCAPKVAAAPTPSPAPSSPTASPAPVAAAQTQASGGQGAAQVASLPATGSNSVAQTATIASAVLAVLAVAARFALSAYQRYGLK